MVVATGAYDVPNRIGVPGEDLPHVSHYYTQPHPFFRKKVVIVGGKNSAAEAALDLYRAGAKVTIVHRRDGDGDSIKYWVKPDIDNRIKEGSIQGRFNTNVVEIRPTSVVVERAGITRRDRRGRRVPADRLRIGHDAAAQRRHRDRCRDLRSRVRPGDVRDQRAWTLLRWERWWPASQSGRIFIENGRFHGDKVIEAIAARLRA